MGSERFGSERFRLVRFGRGGARDERGFSLLELIVSLTIFSLLVGTLVALIATGLRAARNNKDRSVAAHLASQEMDSVRQLSFSRITLGSSRRDVTVSAVRYRVQTDIEWVANNSTTNSCDSSGSSPRVLRVTVTATWPNMAGTSPVATATAISPPVGSYDPDNGHIGVRVRNRNADPLGSVPIRVTGAGFDRTQTTTAASGCAFFGFLAPGSYAVTLGTPGWVDRQGTAIPTQAVGVTAGNSTSVAFDYDRSATIAATLASSGGGVAPMGAPLTLANTGLLPGGTRTYPGVGTVRTITSLFPFADGFTAWAGTCADADPEGLDSSGARYWSGAARDNAITVDPGGSATATINLGTVDLSFSRGSGSGSAPIVAVHAPDGSCASGETLTLTAFGGPTGDQLVALPFGTWSIQAPGQTAATPWPSVTVDPTDTQVPNVDVRIR